VRSGGIVWCRWASFAVSGGRRAARLVSKDTDNGTSGKTKKRTPSDIVRGNEWSDETEGGRVMVGLRWRRRTGSEGVSLDSGWLKR